MSKYNNIAEVLGNVKTREEVLQDLRSNRKAYPIFLDLKKEYQEKFIQFCMGVKGLKMTYDTFFKHIFDAEKYPDRLSEMISAIIGEKLLVKRALPLEHMQISDKGSLLVLDIIVEFETGVKLELLQKFFFIPLDIFFSIKHNEDEGRINNDLEAWLYFIASDRPEDILKVINYHPRFVELYRDICEFRMHPEVAIMMFSEALRRLDENTVQYMIEEQKNLLDEKDKEIERLKRMLAEKE